MSNPTYTPTAEVNAMLAALKMPICRCGAGTDDPCFRVVAYTVAAVSVRTKGRRPVATHCTPCQQGYHGEGGRHGYRGVA
jgi:hypothetical protein